MSEKKTVLIAGATGLVGKFCLQFLLHDDYYQKVIVLSRKAISFSHPKIEEIIVEFDDLEKFKHLIVADHIFCCLGTTMKKAGTKANFRKVDLEYPYELAKLSLSNGATQFNLVSAIGADSRSAIFYNKTKGEIEELISKMDFKSVNIFRPSILLGERTENRPAEKTGIKLMKSVSFLLIGPLSKYKPVEAEKVAKSMVVTAKRELPGINIFESDKIQDMA